GKKLRGLDRFCMFLSRYRISVLIGILVITGIFLYGAFRIRGEVLIQEMFPYDHPYLKLHARFAQVFGSGASGVVITLKTKNGDIFNPHVLARIQKMNNEIELWDEVYRVLTISIASRTTKVVKAQAKGQIKIDSLMWPEVPKNDEEMALLKKDIFSDPAYNGILVSRDGTAALLLTEFKENISYERVFNLLQKLRKDYSDNESSVHIVGFPMLMGWIYSLKSQIYTVFAISIIGMIVVLIIIFYGNILGMIVVMVNALILTIWGLGFIGFTGINFNPLLYVLAFLVGARMVGNSHQITYRYFEELHSSGGDRFRASYETMRTMFIPNFTAVATDAAGFLVLIIAKIVLMQYLAIIMTFWMMSIILTGFLVPAICNLIPLKVASEKWAKDSCQVDGLARLMMRITHFSIGSGSRYGVGTLIILLTILCFWQTSKLKIGDPTPGSPILWPNHPYNQDQALMDRTFDASSENLVLFYEGENGSVYDPAVLTTFEGFARYMKRRLPDIYKSSTSIINMVKIMNVTLHDGDKFWYQLPRNETMSMSLLGYVKANMGFTTSGRFVDEGMERAQITLFFADHTSENLLRIREAAYDFFKDHPMKIGKGEFKLAGGRIGLEMAINEEMMRTHAIIDLTVLGAIFILCTLSFTSVTAGFMLTLPLILANSVAGAYMALSNIGLSINTLPIAAIGVGVGVDFAIYLYSRCQEEFPLQGGDWNRTILQAICTCGKAVVYTGVTIILPIITWYFFSDMKFQAEVGFFLAMIMGTNVVLTLTLHPLMIYIVKPKFISGKKELAVKKEEVLIGEPS
ncbi:MAG TPA: MMPL family transporter, partial [Thermodesulfobacteriota bacterium]|nr:MMPL family transporter [Thermodesulfobacteriota bacterium]